MSADSKVLISLTHSTDEPENVLISYLMGVEALRAGKQAAMWLTKNGIEVALEGFCGTIEVPGAPSIAELHEEYVSSGGQFLVCPVCVKLRDMGEATWTRNATIAGAPAVYAYSEGGVISFSY